MPNEDRLACRIVVGPRQKEHPKSAYVNIWIRSVQNNNPVRGMIGHIDLGRCVLSVRAASAHQTLFACVQFIDKVLDGEVEQFGGTDQLSFVRMAVHACVNKAFEEIGCRISDSSEKQTGTHRCKTTMS